MDSYIARDDYPDVAHRNLTTHKLMSTVYCTPLLHPYLRVRTTVTDATRNLDIFGGMCDLVCVYVCVGACVFFVDTVSLYRSKCTCVFVCEGVTVFVCVCVLAARNFCACT